MSSLSSPFPFLNIIQHQDANHQENELNGRIIPAALGSSQKNLLCRFDLTLLKICQITNDQRKGRLPTLSPDVDQ